MHCPAVKYAWLNVSCGQPCGGGKKEKKSLVWLCSESNRACGLKLEKMLALSRQQQDHNEELNTHSQDGQRTRMKEKTLKCRDTAL